MVSRLPYMDDYVLDRLSYTRVDTAHLVFLGIPPATMPDVECVHVYLMRPEMFGADFISLPRDEGTFPPLKSVEIDEIQSSSLFRYSIKLKFSAGFLGLFFDHLHMRKEVLPTSTL